MLGTHGRRWPIIYSLLPQPTFATTGTGELPDSQCRINIRAAYQDLLDGPQLLFLVYALVYALCAAFPD